MRVFKCYSTERSGHHSVMFWLLHQHQNVSNYIPYGKYDPVIHCNQPHYDAVLFDNLDCTQPHLGGKHNPPYNAIPPNLQLVLFGYERELIEDLQNHQFNNEIDTCGTSPNQIEIVILRDFKNTIASLVNNIPTKTIPNPNMTVKVWKDRAKKVLNKECYFINFNQYNHDPHYRKQVCDELQLCFTDTAFNYRTPSGGGSSFKSDDFPQFNQRYKQVKHQAFFNELKKYQDCVKLSDQIFGEI